MEPIREITSEEEKFRLEKVGPGLVTTRRDPVKAVPEGTLLLVPFRVVGFDSDCDGSLMARLKFVGLDQLEKLGEIDEEDVIYPTLKHWGLYPDTGFVTSKEELIVLRDREGSLTEE
jgi:hypothetical protein